MLVGWDCKNFSSLSLFFLFKWILVCIISISLLSVYVAFFHYFFLISWRLITLQYCSGFCHTLTWISHGYTVKIMLSPSHSICSVTSHVRHFETPWTAACQAFLSFTISCSLLKLMSIELVILSNHLIFCCPLLFLLSISPRIRVFSNELAFHIR